MPLRNLLALIFCNVIWSAHPLMGKLLLAEVGPAQGAWLRYAGALLSYAVAMGAIRAFSRRGPGREEEAFLIPRTRRDGALLLGLGLSAFCLSPLLQMTGLASSRATDSSLIVAMEPLATVFLAWLVLGERPSRVHFTAFGVALAGFALLTEGKGGGTGAAWDPHLMGNLLILLSLGGEALYSSLGRKLIAHHAPTAVFGTALLIGVVLLTFSLLVLGEPLSPGVLTGITWKGALALIWVGPLGTALSYLYWMNTLKYAPVATIALTLFIQPVLGPLWGYVFLSERLSVMQGFGSALILLAVFGQTWAEIRAARVG